MCAELPAERRSSPSERPPRGLRGPFAGLTPLGARHRIGLQSETAIPYSVDARLAGCQPFVRPVSHRTASNEDPAASHDEEDVSAKEARAKARAWLHGPHGYQGRSPRARPSPGQGAQEADRLSGEPPQGRMPALSTLRRRVDFEAIARDGRSRSTPLLVVRWLRTERAETRVGLSTPRALGGAVQRNRVRRRLRGLVRQRLDDIGPGWDLLLIARPAAGQATYADLGHALDALLQGAGIGS